MAILAAASAALALASIAHGSALIDRNPTGISLSVSRAGLATVSYRARGQQWHVLAWGAANAIAPTTARPQVRFHLDYSGGWGAFHRELWRTPNACRRYTGPPLHWLVTACTAPDGSYWAVQRWQRMLPLLGGMPGSGQTAWELHLSHWTGPLAALEIQVDSLHRNDVLYGRFSYRGKAIHGFHSTRRGAPLDTYGRNIYVDTYASSYGSGWRRANGFLARKPFGLFCYLLPPENGKGTAYRATAVGPGVTPDVFWQGRPAPALDSSSAPAAPSQRSLAAAAHLCGI
jgi:hypothetical protein